MAFSHSKIQTASLDLGSGWSGKAVLADAAGRHFLKVDWLKCLSQPHLLFEDTEKILKSEGRNCVAVKTITVGCCCLKVIIKRHYPQVSLRQFFRSLRQGRALRNFNTALKLQRLGIPVAAPYAALHKRLAPFTEQSIFITEYFEDGSALKNFAKNQVEHFAPKKQLCHQLASILASLHQNGLRHRDPKAANFIVRKDAGGKYQISLIDTDGIKPYFLFAQTQRLRSLWQLAASLLSIPALSRTDYLRLFSHYSSLTGIDPSRRRALLRELSEKAEAKYRKSKSEPKNILIIKPSSLGDIVMALPALSALRRSFPDAKISWLVRTEFAPLLKNHPDLSEVILFDRKFLGHSWYNPRAFAALISLIRKLRRGRFDAVIDLQGLFRTAAFAWLTGCPKRLGMADAREFGHIFYTAKVPQDSESIHLVDYYLKIVQAAGASALGVRFSLPVDSAAADKVKNLLKTNGVNADYAVFVPTSAQQNKCWPAENFAALADRVSKDFGLSIIATGAPSEKDAVEALRSKAKVPIANFAGATSIPELVALLNGAKFVISNDTGPGHIAAALGIPVVMLFGPTNPARVHPYNRPQCAVAVEPAGRGLKADSCDPKHDIKLITLDEVYKKVCEQLNRRSSLGTRKNFGFDWV
jgi:lipopolysaccharide heptosyltransferase I